MAEENEKNEINPSGLNPDGDAKPENKRSLDEQWAEVLGMEFDEEEARRRLPPTPDAQQPPRIPNPPYTGLNQPGTPHQPSFGQQQPFGQNPSGGQPPFNGQYPPFEQQPFAAQKPVELEKMPPTYLVWSILSLVLCCSIAGIVAVVFSTMVSSRFYAHDYEGSRRASRNAQIWIIISIVLGVVTNAIYLPLLLLGGA